MSRSVGRSPILFFDVFTELGVAERVLRLPLPLAQSLLQSTCLVDQRWIIRHSKRVGFPGRRQ